MTLPRWLVACLLGVSLLIVIASAFLWWITWPTHVANDFLTNLASGESQAWQVLVEPPWDFLEYAEVYDSGQWEFHPRWESRTIADVIWGRRRFWLHEEGGFVMVAERGRVHFGNSFLFIDKGKPGPAIDRTTAGSRAQPNEGNEVEVCR